MGAITSDPAPPAVHGFVSQRRRLSYVDWGNAAAPLLVLIHGSRDHARSWDWTARALRDDWHVVAVDLCGHGDSAWSPEGRYDFPAYLYDLARLCDHLGGGPVTIMAHSLGAHIALRFAGIYPEAVARLIAVEAVGAPGGMDVPPDATPVAARIREWIARRHDAATRAPRRYATLAAAAARMIAGNPRLSAGQAAHLTRHGTTQHGDGSYGWKFDGHLHVWPYPDMPDADADALWQAIRCPVLLLYGRESWSSDVPARLRRALPDARYVELAGAGHWPHHDRLTAFLKEAGAFLAG